MIGLGLGITANIVKLGKKIRVKDTFTRADNDQTIGNAETGQTWSVIEGVTGIIGNQAYGPADETSAIIDSGVSDCIVSMDFPVTSESCGIYFRATNIQNFFILTQNVTNYILKRKVADVNTTLQTISVTPANGDVLKVVLNGSSITAYVNGVAQTPVTDTFQQTATKHGFDTGYANIAARADNFLVTDL